MGLFGDLGRGILFWRVWNKASKEAKVAGLKAVGFGLLSAVALGIYVELAAKCPGLVENWQQVLMAGVLGGLGKWLHSGRSK